MREMCAVHEQQRVVSLMRTPQRQHQLHTVLEHVCACDSACIAIDNHRNVSLLRVFTKHHKTSALQEHELIM